MDNFVLSMSTDTLIRLFLILLYSLVALFAYKRFIPRMSAVATLLATIMLAAQILVILISLEFRPISDFQKWLWHLGGEWNIPATLASTQLAMVAGISLVTALLARTRPVWQRLYLLGIGLVFLFMAWDEFTVIHESIQDWWRAYTTLGAVVVAATAIVALRSPRRSWLWHFCLLAGLAMAAFGAIVLDQLRYTDICGRVAMFQLSGCKSETPFEEPLEFLGIWLVLLAVLGQFSDAVPPQKPKIQRILYVLPALWISVMFLVHPIFTLEIPTWARPESVQFESGLRLLGYSFENTTSAAIVRLFSTTRQSIDEQMGYSVHIVDQVTGDSIASRNDILNSRDKVSLGKRDFTPLYLQQIEIDILPDVHVNQALWIVLTHWKEYDGKFMRQKVLSSDRHLLNDTQVVLDELVLPAVPPPIKRPICDIRQWVYD